MSVAPVIPLIGYNYSAFLGIIATGRLFILNCVKGKSEIGCSLTLLVKTGLVKRTKNDVVV